MTNKSPDRLDIEISDRKLYNDKVISKEIFFGASRKEQFLFSMAIGFKNKVKIPLKSREGFFLAKDLNDKDITLINSVAIYDSHSLDILTDLKDIFRIAEEYAHAGIKILFDEINSEQPGTFLKKYEHELFQLIDRSEG